METTRLSSKGQVVIPRAIRQARHWPIGQEFEVQETEQGLLLRPKALFAPTRLEDVAGCLSSSRPAVSLEEMEAAIARGVEAQGYGRR